jgi:hypothetical protein
MNTSFFQPNHGDPAPLRPLGINHVHRPTHEPHGQASVKQGVDISSCGSWPLQESSLMTSWRSTWKTNSLHTMASDPPAMNHPSDVLTFWRFVSDWLGFLLLCAALVHGKRNALLGKSTQIHHVQQSLQPSHHGDHTLRLRSLHWCPPLTTTTRTDSHF